jgi:polyhydroxybutyrate depolymerase
MKDTIYNHDIEVDGAKRSYNVYLPEGYDGRQMAAMLVFHGGGGNPGSAQRQSLMDNSADENGFITVYPRGNGVFNVLTWNAGNCCGHAVQKNIDDVKYVRALIDDLCAQYNIDKSRIYATGISNGAMLCYRLAQEANDVIAAIAPIAGNMGFDPVPTKPVPIIHFHGLLDQHMPFDGGTGSDSVTPVAQRPVMDTINFWVANNHCDPTPNITTTADMIRCDWIPQESGAPVTLCVLPSGGHQWAGGHPTAKWLNGGPFIKDVDADQLMWNFFVEIATPTGNPS